MFNHMSFIIPAGAIMLSFSMLAFGEEIKIGLSAEPSSVDPHYHTLTPNEQLKKHIFEALTDFDEERNLKPVLAISWKATGPTTWEFKLRKDVKFHDGSPFTAQDFIYTLCRIPQVVNSPGPFTVVTRGIVGAKAPDPYTLIIETAKTSPLIPNEMSKIGIISSRLNKGEKVTFNKDGCSGAEWPVSKDFNNGKLAIGTGPYTFNEFVPGNRIVLSRNEQYWGVKPHWAKVIFRPLVSDAPRVAALLAGDVDLIESPPMQDVIRLLEDGRFDLARAGSARIIYLAMDSVSATNTASGGASNPLKDIRVREAISRAIDRFAIRQKVMGGFSAPAWQLYRGSGDSKIGGWYNVARAKELLAQAGYPNGFDITLSATNNRYPNDAIIAQTIAQMLTAVGIKTKVDVMPANLFFPKQAKGELPFRMAGFLASTGEPSYLLRALVATPNKEKGNGTLNFDKYSNQAADSLIDEALNTLDDSKRRGLLQRASNIVIEDFGIIPLHYEVNLWAMKKTIRYAGRWDQKTYVPEITAVRTK